MAGMYPDNQTISIFGEEVSWPGLDPTTGKFTNGSFTNPLVKPSFIPAESINLLLDNLSNLITGLGGSPNNTAGDQLKNAFLSFAATRAPFKTTLTDAAESSALPPITDTELTALLQAVRNFEKYLNSKKAPLASPALTGTPTAPTAAKGTNTTQLATTAFVRAALDTYFYVGKMIIQYPDEKTPVEAGYPGNWETWSNRAILYGVSTSALPSYSNYSGSFIGSTIGAGSMPYVLYSETGGDSRLYRFKSQANAYIVPADFDPVQWERYSTNVTIVERQKAGNALGDGDYTIGTKITSGTYANRYVTEIIVPGGKFFGVEGGNRPTVISDGRQDDRIRDITGDISMQTAMSATALNGALFSSASHSVTGSGWQTLPNVLNFAARLVVPTGPDNAPANLSIRLWRRVS
jgi:hypothetical protein